MEDRISARKPPFYTLGFWERHLLTDEMFVLLGGTAILCTKDKSGLT